MRGDWNVLYFVFSEVWGSLGAVLEWFGDVYGCVVLLSVVGVWLHWNGVWVWYCHDFWAHAMMIQGSCIH